jgi:hypothetical protein
MPSDPDRDPETISELIERITVDAYGDEGHVSFLCAFEDELDYPIAATLAGAPTGSTGSTTTVTYLASSA